MTNEGRSGGDGDTVSLNLKSKQDASQGGATHMNPSCFEKVDDNYLRRVAEQLEADMARSRSDHERKIKEMKDVQRTYLYGLQKVAKLQDLRDAPDAIMPGNFPGN